MTESLENAKEELKRIDHLIYVTLKYTRTVDVFLSVIERMINAYQYIVERLLDDLVEEGTLTEKPGIPLERAKLILKHYKSKKIHSNIEKYLLFRRLRRAEYEKSNEFRRHVTMTATVDGKVEEVTIDTITEDYHELRDFINYVEKTVE